MEGSNIRVYYCIVYNTIFPLFGVRYQLSSPTLGTNYVPPGYPSLAAGPPDAPSSRRYCTEAEDQADRFMPTDGQMKYIHVAMHADHDTTLSWSSLAPGRRLFHALAS